MNFMFHSTLDAVGNILRVHYKSVKCDVSLSQGSLSTLFRRDEHVFHVCVKLFYLLTAVQKLLKNQTSFSQLWSQMYCHIFMRHSVCKMLSLLILLFCLNPLSYSCRAWMMLMMMTWLQCWWCCYMCAVMYCFVVGVWRGPCLAVNGVKCGTGVCVGCRPLLVHPVNEVLLTSILAEYMRQRIFLCRVENVLIMHRVGVCAYCSLHLHHARLRPVVIGWAGLCRSLWLYTLVPWTAVAHPLRSQAQLSSLWALVWRDSDTPFTRYNQLSDQLYHRFDNRLYRVNEHPTGNRLYTHYSHLSTRLSNGFDNRLNVCIHDTTGCQTGLTVGLTTGCIVYTNIYPVVKPDWQPVWQQVVSCTRGLSVHVECLQ